ncbi:MAG: prolyl oligopeptidase family serine peptidase, partial [Verrucomicrobiales bacterium]|nr:prolyl oligopeptidase family serine peptidase [Verrucomicrobiales bacterium]
MKFSFVAGCLVMGISVSAFAQSPDTRLTKFLAKFPAADSDADGKLTMEEALAYRKKMRGDKTSTRKQPDSPAKRYPIEELAELYEARDFRGMPFRFFEPEIKEGEKYPLVLSLHGAGGKGRDNRKNLKPWNGTLAEPELQKKYPCFIVAPQSAGPWRVAGKDPDLTAELVATFPPVWKQVMEKRAGFVAKSDDGVLGIVFDLLDQIAETYPVDVDRVYVLGHSMGGFGTFESIARQPNRFAAAIPSAGGLVPWHDPETFKHVPVWAFHGEQDSTVIPELTGVVFEQMK